jgi:hypothetical protein
VQAAPAAAATPAAVGKSAPTKEHAVLAPTRPAAALPVHSDTAVARTVCSTRSSLDTAAAAAAACEQTALWVVVGAHSSASGSAYLALGQVTSAGTWLHASRPVDNSVTVNVGGHSLRAILRSLPLNSITVNPVRAFDAMLGWATELQQRQLLPDSCAALQRALQTLQRSPLTPTQRVRLACYMYSGVLDAPVARPTVRLALQALIEQPTVEHITALTTLDRAASLALPLSAWTTQLPAAEVQRVVATDISNKSSTTSTSNYLQLKRRRKLQEQLRTVVWCYCISAAQLPTAAAPLSPTEPLVSDLVQGFTTLRSLCMNYDSFSSLVKAASGVRRLPLPDDYTTPPLPFETAAQVEWHVSVMAWVAGQLDRKNDSVVITHAHGVLAWRSDQNNSCIGAVYWNGPMQCIINYLAQQCTARGAAVLDTAVADSLVRCARQVTAALQEWTLPMMLKDYQYELAIATCKLLLQHDAVTVAVTQAVRGELWLLYAKATERTGHGQQALELCYSALEDSSVVGWDQVSRANLKHLNMCTCQRIALSAAVTVRLPYCMRCLTVTLFQKSIARWLACEHHKESLAALTVAFIKLTHFTACCMLTALHNREL